MNILNVIVFFSDSIKPNYLNSPIFFVYQFMKPPIITKLNVCNQVVQLAGKNEILMFLKLISFGCAENWSTNGDILLFCAAIFVFRTYICQIFYFNVRVIFG